MEYLLLSWADIEEQCAELAKKIEERAPSFDVIIGISRGGWVPARLLSDLLGNDEVDTVRVKFYKSVGQTAKKPVILLSTQIDITGKDILLVDDIADTGESLVATIEHMREKGVKNISVVTLIKKPQSILTPDFFVRETPDWVIFPWEISETKRDIEARFDSKEELEKELFKAGLLL
jgi:hypoxanthine phosphoribosyltransferase